MSRKFSDFMKELEEETRREGPRAVAEAEVFKAHFKLAAGLILLRKRRRLTQQQLSAKSGVQQAEISRIEGGRGNPTVSTLSALAGALGGELSIRPVPRGTRAGGHRPARSRTAARRVAGAGAR